MVIHSHTTRSGRTPAAIVLCVALLLRLCVVAVVIAKYPSGWLYTRGMEMGLLAHSLLAGHGLSSPFGGSTGPTAFLAPGYPFFVAAVFFVFGTYSTASAICIMVVNIIANLLTVYCILRIARALCGEVAAFVAAFFWACSPPLLWMPTIFWETSFSSCILLGAIAFVLHVRQNSTPKRWLLLGAYCAAGGLINPALLPSLMAIIAWLVMQTPAPQRKKALLAVAAFILMFSPWPIRNARTFHAFIPMRTTVGYELWMGNRPGATGYLDESLFPTFNKQELNDYIARGELGYTHHKSELAFSFIRTHARIFLQLTAVRIFRYWTGTGTRGGSPLFLLHALLTTTLGFMGVVQLARRRQIHLAILFALPLLLFPLPYCITHPEFRYRLAIDPLLTALAAVPIAAWLKSFARIESRSKLLPAEDDAQASLA